LIYVILGAAGLPVFAMARAGVSVIAGPGGGFILGYIAMAATVGFIVERKGHSMKWLIAAMAAGCLVVYACGLAWFMALTGAGLISAMTMCMFPFLPGDAVKVVLGAFLVNRYRKYIHL
jgi:biotin transport system substrate-specific component